MSEQGVPAGDLSDSDLVDQGVQAHATRTWVFLHGTAEQFRRHTERMLELEQEYLRRFPKRTWQSSGGAGHGTGEVDLGRLDRMAQIRLLTRNYARAVEQLLADAAEPEARPEPGSRPGHVAVDLLRRYAAAPAGRMHKLEAHQAAREVGLPPAAVAELFRADPPLLVTAGEYRQITEAGRDRLG